MFYRRGFPRPISPTENTASLRPTSQSCIAGISLITTHFYLLDRRYLQVFAPNVRADVRDAYAMTEKFVFVKHSFSNGGSPTSLVVRTAKGLFCSATMVGPECRSPTRQEELCRG